MSIKISKDVSATLERLRQLNAVLEFDRDYGPDEEALEEYRETSAEMSEVFEPLMTRLCQAGLIQVHAFVGDLVREPNSEKYLGIEGCPKWANADKLCELDGKITLYLNQDCASYGRNRAYCEPTVIKKEEELKLAGGSIN